MSYTVNEVLNLVDKIAESFSPIYTLTKSGGTTHTEINAAETQVLGYDTYDKEYQLLYGIHQTVLKVGSSKVSSIYRDSLTAINTALGGFNTWLTDNDKRLSILENLMCNTNSITIEATNIFPDAAQTMFTLAGTVLSPPTTPAAVAGSATGTFTDGTYYITITAINECGETLESTETSVTLSGGTSVQSIDVSCDVVADATGYKFYEGGTGAELYSGTDATNSYTILDPAAGVSPPTVSTAHEFTDGIAIDTDITGAAKANYKVTTQGSNDILLTIHEILEDDSTTTEDITVTGSSGAGVTFALTNEVKDITQISISSTTPGQATDSGTIVTVADR